MPGLAGDDLDAGDRLVLGLVRQHRAVRHVADGEDALNIGAEVVRLDVAALVDRDAYRIQAQPLGDRLAADGQQDAIRLDGLGRAAGYRFERVSSTASPFSVRAGDLGARAGRRCPACVSVRWKAFAISPSRPGVMRSRNSTTVTFEPRRRHTEPELQPDDARADHDQMVRGPPANESAPVESTIRS